MIVIFRTIVENLYAINVTSIDKSIFYYSKVFTRRYRAIWRFVRRIFLMTTAVGNSIVLFDLRQQHRYLFNTKRFVSNRRKSNGNQHSKKWNTELEDCFFSFKAVTSLRSIYFPAIFLLSLILEPNEKSSECF